jgi:hypothetical protein
MLTTTLPVVTGGDMATAEKNTPPVRAPERRVIRAYAFDPMSTRLSGRRLEVPVRYEHDLRPGPMGELVHVVDYDATRRTWYSPVDLNDPAILAQRGLRPTEGDPRTHQQVVYAVAMSVIERFERFLGRRFRWRSDRALRLVPHAFEGRNAFFDPKRRAVLFGYYRADSVDPGPNLPGQVMFTCLSGDIVAHEVTHAIVHRLRRYYSEATNVDVLAWHEAFADLVALFQHFTFPDVVAEAIANAHGDVAEGAGLLDLAKEFGESTGRGGALRRGVGEPPAPATFAITTEPHERGAAFVLGVFAAYLSSHRARIADLLRIATGGTGVLPPGQLHPDLVARITSEAVKNADRFLGMVVRAFDYLPVVDVTFGDVLRAIVTADRLLYPDDTLQLRGSLVESLRQRGIYPSRVAALTDESLTWPRPAPSLRLTLDGSPIDLSALILSATRDLDPTGDPGEHGRARRDQRGQADGRSEDIDSALKRWATHNAYQLGLDPDVRINLRGVHVAYREAEDRQPRPEIVLQLEQRREDLEDSAVPESMRVRMRAGTTVIASVDGQVDYVVAKPFPLSDPERLADVDTRIAAEARRHHEAGRDRLAAVRQWLDCVEEDDALSAWTIEPAVQRLTFAALHAVHATREDRST